MLRLERPGFRAAARAETGDERPDGVRVKPFVEALGDRVLDRDGDDDPLTVVVWFSEMDDLGVPDLRGVVAILGGRESEREKTRVNEKDTAKTTQCQGKEKGERRR